MMSGGPRRATAQPGRCEAINLPDDLVSALFLPMILSFAAGLFAANRLTGLVDRSEERGTPGRLGPMAVVWFALLGASALIMGAWFVSAVIIAIVGGAPDDPPS
jgi:hypothetical protein